MKITRKFFWPQNVYIITTLMSFMGWITPDFGVLRKGFDKPQDLASAAGCWVLLSIFLCYMALKIGFIIGGGRNEVESEGAHIFSSDTVYILVIGLAFLGDAYSVISIYRSGGMSIILSSFTDGSANDLKKTLYENYSAGFATLRYTSILAGALLFARRLCGVRRFLYDIGALLSLLLCALISSRLSLIAACFGGGYLYMQAVGHVRVKIGRIILVGILLFLMLSVLSWTRNKNFYSSRGMGFLSSGVSEIVTYLGTPFQGQIFSFFDPEYSVKNDLYFKGGVEVSLTTNSAFIDLFSDYGDYGYVIGIFALFLSGLAIGLFGHLKRGKFSIVCFPIAYGIAEFWRIFLFDKGILIYLVALTMALSWFFGRGKSAIPRKIPMT